MTNSDGAGDGADGVDQLGQSITLLIWLQKFLGILVVVARPG